MDILEMHIDFDIKFQKVNSNRYRALLPEEKDWLINDATLKLIDERVYPKPLTRMSVEQKFQDTKPKYDEFEELVTTKVLTAYKADSTLGGYNDNANYVILPSDYYKLIDDKSHVIWKCDGGVRSDTTKLLYVTEVYFAKDVTHTTPNLYDNLAITINTGLGNMVVFDIANYPPINNGIDSEELKFQLVNLIFDVVNYTKFSGVQVYWEKFRNTYKKDTFFFVSEQATTSIDIILNGATTNVVTTIASIPAYNFTGTDLKYKSDRLIMREEIDDLLSFSFGSTLKDSPLSTLQRGNVIVYFDNTFNIPDVVIDYIRRPRKVNIELGISSEVNKNMHEKIIDTAAQRAAAIIESGNLRNLMLNNQQLNT